MKKFKKKNCSRKSGCYNPDSYWKPYIETSLEEEYRRNNKNRDWLMTRCEKTTERYIEAEEFLMNLKWWEKIFTSGKINKFIKSRVTKYNF